MDATVQLHHLDLQTIENLRKLQMRLTNGLRSYDQQLARIAYLESCDDFEVAGLSPPAPPDDGVSNPVDPVSPLSIKANLEVAQAKVLVALKKSVFDTSNNLRTDHQRRDVIIAQSKERKEFLEEELLLEEIEEV
jgi:hypothetical protein